jgi:repressor LexA
MTACCALCKRPFQSRVGLTARQLQLLDFIKAYIAEHGIAPSFDEMVVALGVSTKSVIHRHLKKLEGRGYILRIPALARAIHVFELAGASQ